MAKKASDEASQDQQQPYDNLLKSLLGGQEKHKLPVKSVIVYPFLTKMAEPPFREEDEDGEIVTFHFQRDCARLLSPPLEYGFLV